MDVVTILYQAFKASTLINGPKKVTGDIYKNKRPINSSKEDVVINSLPINFEQLQEGVANANLYVPNLELPLNGLTDKTQPNAKRLTELTAIAISELGEIEDPNGEYSFILQQSNLFEGDNNDHYVNLRYEFSSINI